MNKGIFYAIGAYVLWGFLPVYWKALQGVPAPQILAQRMVWSLVFLLAILAVQRSWAPLRLALRAPRILFIYLVAAALLSVNWLTYIWGVNAGFVIETSLGYFINPLVNILLGVIFLRERLRLFQWLSIGLAAAGVIYLTVTYGALPWIALVLAFTFGAYGLLKKMAPLGSLHSLSLETLLLFLPALFYLLLVESQGSGAFVHRGLQTSVLLAFTGVVTATPLLLFGAGARRINLSTLGFLQFIAPTCQLILGIFLYAEPFSTNRLIGFSLIWLALLFYSLEAWRENRRARRERAALVESDAALV